MLWISRHQISTQPLCLKFFEIQGSSFSSVPSPSNGISRFGKRQKIYLLSCRILRPGDPFIFLVSWFWVWIQVRELSKGVSLFFFFFFLEWLPLASCFSILGLEKFLFFLFLDVKQYPHWMSIICPYRWHALLAISTISWSSLRLLPPTLQVIICDFLQFSVPPTLGCRHSCSIN